MRLCSFIGTGHRKPQRPQGALTSPGGSFQLRRNNDRYNDRPTDPAAKNCCHCEEGGSPTWQSPALIHRHREVFPTFHREIATGLTALAMTVVKGSRAKRSGVFVFVTLREGQDPPLRICPQEGFGRYPMACRSLPGCQSRVCPRVHTRRPGTHCPLTGGDCHTSVRYSSQ